MPTDPNNNSRADWAREALDTFAHLTWGKPLLRIDKEGWAFVASDLVADLMHFVKRDCPPEDDDPDLMIDRARDHYMEEVLEEEREEPEEDPT